MSKKIIKNLFLDFQVNCKLTNETNDKRDPKAIPEDFIEGEILDRIEVFNSVEVLAPEIDLFSENYQLQASGKWENGHGLISSVNTSQFSKWYPLQHLFCKCVHKYSISMHVVFFFPCTCPLPLHEAPKTV